jgi:HlyD family secretion protein
MNIYKSKITLLLSLILILMLSACIGDETPIPEPVESLSLDHVISEGHILPRQDAWLNFSAQGKVAEILVEEGEKVSTGQALVRLDGQGNAWAALKNAELVLKQAQQDFDDFIRTSDLAAATTWGAYLNAQELRGEAEEKWENLDLENLEDKVDDALIDVRDQEDDLEEALEDWEKYEDVDPDNYARQRAEDDLEDAQDDINEAQRDLEEAIRKIDKPRSDLDTALAAETEAKRDYEMLLEEGYDLDQKSLLESRVSAAEAGLRAARKNLDNYTLTAPFPGTVTDIYLELGQFVGPEARAVLLADLSEFIIETSDLTELEVVKIYVGQIVEIIPDALPELVLTGIVEEIGSSFTTQAGDILYTVTISLNKGDPNLRWGMTVELTFIPE